MTHLNTSILSFAFSGVLAQAKRNYDPPKPVSQPPRKDK